jgi:hypothetical protein
MGTFSSQEKLYGYVPSAVGQHSKYKRLGIQCCLGGVLTASVISSLNLYMVSDI